MFSIMGSSVLLGGEGVSPVSIMGSSVLLGGEGISLKTSSTYTMMLHDRHY